LIIDRLAVSYFLKAEAIAGAIFLIGVGSALVALRSRLAMKD
jgi:hypothetical protein